MSKLEQETTEGMDAYDVIGADPGKVFCSQCHGEIEPVNFKLRDKKGGDPSKWPNDLRVREMPNDIHQG